jgi:hypothetical protein
MDTQLGTQPDLQRLLRRQGEIQRAMRCPGGIRITVERELHAIREQLKRYQGAQQTQGVGGSGAAGAGSGLGSHTPHAAQP